MPNLHELVGNRNRNRNRNIVLTWSNRKRSVVQWGGTISKYKYLCLCEKSCR